MVILCYYIRVTQFIHPFFLKRRIPIRDCVAKITETTMNILKINGDEPPRELPDFPLTYRVARSTNFGQIEWGKDPIYIIARNGDEISVPYNAAVMQVLVENPEHIPKDWDGLKRVWFIGTTYWTRAFMQGRAQYHKPYLWRHESGRWYVGMGEPGIYPPAWKPMKQVEMFPETIKNPSIPARAFMYFSLSFLAVLSLLSFCIVFGSMFAGLIWTIQNLGELIDQYWNALLTTFAGISVFSGIMTWVGFKVEEFEKKD